MTERRNVIMTASIAHVRSAQRFRKSVTVKLLDLNTLTRSNCSTEDLQISRVTVIKFIRHKYLARGTCLSLTLVFQLF